MNPVRRRAARLLVVDPETRVLLFQYEDDRRRWWATPGGGLKHNETFEDAAAREAAEELSVTGTTLKPLWCQRVEFTFRGQSIRQIERYFLIRLSDRHIALETSLEMRRCEGIISERWW